MDIPKISEQTAAGLTPFEPNPDKVYLCFDGSTEATICAQILKDQGFAVEGFFFMQETNSNKENIAKNMAQKLGIPLSCVSLQVPDEIDLMKTEFSMLYLSLLNDLAEEKSIKFIASGHNAKVAENENGLCVISGEEKSCNHAEKMQDLPLSILEKLCLPNGEFTENEIQEMALALNLL